MASSHVWVLPGFLGSHIHTSRPRGFQQSRHLWFWPPALIGPLHTLLRYPDDGSLFAPALLDEYTPLVQYLARTAPQDVGIIPRPYDWRPNVQSAADRLADRIEETSDGVPQSQYLVGHSMGGLLARATWRVLTERGKGDLIKRIVTIGTPHRGCYGVPQVWLERDSDFNLAAKVQALPTMLVPFVGPFVGDVVIEELHRTFSSWPAGYQLLPLADAAGIEADPMLPALYDAETWGPSLAQPMQALLDFARNDWWPWINAPEGWPPASVLRCVAGRGWSTPVRLTPRSDRLITTLPGSPGRGIGIILKLNRLALLPGLETSEEGDGTVPLASALPAGYQSLTLAGSHSRLPSHPALLAELWELLLDDPPTEPVPPKVVADPVHPQVTPQQIARPQVTYRPCCHHPEQCPT